MLKAKTCAVLLSVAALLTACAPQAEPTPSASPSSPPAVIDLAPAKDTPTPDAAQAKKLVADLGKVSPALDKPFSAVRAGKVCEGILGGKTDEQLKADTKTVFEDGSGIPLSDAQITDVVKIIKTNSFCKK
jgi:hypothetical protein